MNLYRYLRQRAPTLLYDWQERGEIRFKAGDIILGHPHPNPNTLVQKAILNDRRCKVKALIFPMHHAIPRITEFTLPLLERADMVFGIMGPYWYDTLDNSHFAPWKHKIIRLDMAIDTHQYPLIKKQFNPPGRRGYLYIGSNRPEKGCEILGKTMAQLRDFPKGWIGGGPDIPNVPRIATYAHLTPKFVSSLATKYDIFVNTSISDANPTTILEAMAWGFPVACTPQSGYYKIPSIITLSTTDIEANVKALLELQYAPEEYLLQLSMTNRRLVEMHYTWERFCTTVWQVLEPYVLE
jgi:glycosyltransferase involved in cell wall biosynthesis